MHGLSNSYKEHQALLRAGLNPRLFWIDFGKVGGSGDVNLTANKYLLCHWFDCKKKKKNPYCTKLSGQAAFIDQPWNPNHFCPGTKTERNN